MRTIITKTGNDYTLKFSKEPLSEKQATDANVYPYKTGNDMLKFKIILIGSMWLICATASAGWAPQAVQDSLKQLYPNIGTTAWKSDHGYYVAGFEYKDFNTQVWFNTKGEWVMKQTDWQTLDEVPMPVYHAFTMGSYASYEVLDVTYVEFPQKSPLVVLLVQQPDIETEYQLFFTPDGELVNMRNATYLNNPLGAGTFL